jgi:hypothetical protein
VSIIIRPPLITTPPPIIIIKPPIIMILARTKRQRITPTRLTNIASRGISTQRPHTSIRINSDDKRRAAMSSPLFAPGARNDVVAASLARGKVIKDSRPSRVQTGRVVASRQAWKLLKLAGVEGD